MKDWENKLNTITNIAQLTAAIIVIFTFLSTTVLWAKYTMKKK